MRVAALWRYPVKSLRGERMTRVDVTATGIVGDRRYGLLDLSSGTILSAKREGRLLEAQALLAGPELTIRLPTGETALGLGPNVDRALTAWLGFPVRLVEATPEGRATYQSLSDYYDDFSTLTSWEGPPGSFVDSSPVHVLTTATLRAAADQRPDLQWEVARFRPNLLIDAGRGDGGGDSAAGPEGTVEQSWIGRRLDVGDVRLEVRKGCTRCVMTTRAQPGGLTRQLDVLRHIDAEHDRRLGVLAGVERGGAVAEGDPVTLALDG